MTQADFVKAIKSQHGEEETDANKYMELAKNAPTPAIGQVGRERVGDGVNGIRRSGGFVSTARVLLSYGRRGQNGR